MKDLDGKVVGLFNDPAAEEEVKRIVPNAARLEKYEDGYFDLLAQGKIDGFVYDYPYAQEEIKEFGGRLEIVEFNLTRSSYAAGVKKGANALKRAQQTDDPAAAARRECRRRMPSRNSV